MFVLRLSALSIRSTQELMDVNTSIYASGQNVDGLTGTAYGTFATASQWWHVRAAPYLYQISFFNLNKARYAKCLNSTQQPFASTYSDLFECDLAWWLASSLVSGVNLNYACDPLSVREYLAHTYDLH